MSGNPEVIVIGGGPAGCFAALKLAQMNVDVTLYEEHEKIGVPSHCPGHLSIGGLRRLGMYPLPEKVVENVFNHATFYSPNCKSFSVGLEKPTTCAVNRALFDRSISQQAQNAGANICVNSRVEDLILEENVVKGVFVRREGKMERTGAKVVIDAEGISSRLLREAGLQGLNRSMLVNGVEAEVENIRNIDSNSVELYFGAEYAPGFYGWIIPKKDGSAKVGLAAKTGNPKKFLEKFVTKHPVVSSKLKDSRIARTAFHPLSLGGPTPKSYSSGLLVVGDAASQVKPTTGGGVIFGMTCAALAAQVASKAIENDDFSSKSLSTYQRRCDESFGFDLKAMVRMRKTLDGLSDDKLNRLIDMCAKLGLDKTLRNVEDIDLQGRMLLQVLRSPRMLTAIGYFLLTYLIGNP